MNKYILLDLESEVEEINTEILSFPELRESIDQLSPLAENLYYRLLVNVDDFGRIESSVKSLRVNENINISDECSGYIIRIN